MIEPCIICSDGWQRIKCYDGVYRHSLPEPAPMFVCGNQEEDSLVPTYAKVSEVKSGDTLYADGGFTCMKAGPKLVQADASGSLYIPCSQGKHHLNGQLEGDHYIGLYKEQP